MVQGHPDQASLQAFGLGRLEQESATQAIAEHLDSCVECRRRLEEMPKDMLLTLLEQGETPINSLLELPEPGPARTCELPTGPSEAGLPAEFASHPRYRLVEPLGSGGMGAVYKAEHLVMDRTVALKVISRSLIGKQPIVERFRREVRAAARLVHPNIVTAFDADQAGDSHFLVMEFVSGTTLARLVQEQGPLPVATACEYVRQAAVGLQHAYAHGMVHRDIKPHNLMVVRPSRDREGVAAPLADARGSDGGQIKILDFGLARFASEVASQTEATGSGASSSLEPGMTGAGMVLGTAEYIAPEQADDPHQADIRADIYSLGCTLYFLLSGQPPFPEGTVMQKLKAHQNQTPRRITSLRADVPADLVPVLERMLAKKPTERFQTPAEVAHALVPFAGTDGASLTPSLTPVIRSTGQPASPGLACEPAARRQRVRPLVAALAAMILVAAGLLAFGVYRVATDYGEFVVEVNDKQVETLLTKGGVTIHDRATGRKYQLKPGRHDVKTGKYEIVVTELPEGIEFSTTEFTIKRGGKEAIKASLNWMVRDRDKSVGEVRRFEGHTRSVWRATFTPDGRRALSGGWDRTMRLWDLQTGKELKRFEGHSNPVLGLAVSPDGKTALTGAGAPDNSARLWDVETGRELRCLEGHTNAVWSVAFSPDGQRALTASLDGTVRLWEVASGKELLCLDHKPRVLLSVAFLPDGRHIVSAPRDDKDPTVWLWDLENSKVVRHFRGHKSWIECVAVSADGRFLLSAANDRTLRLWDVESGEQVRSFVGHKGMVTTVAFSPDGRRALSGSHDKTMRLWDIASGEELFRFEGHTDRVQSVCFSPDGRFALSTGAEKDPSVRVWRLPDPPAAQP